MFCELPTTKVEGFGCNPKVKGKWRTQSYRFNLDDYKSPKEVIEDIMPLRLIDKEKKDKAVKLVYEFFETKK